MGAVRAEFRGDSEVRRRQPLSKHTQRAIRQECREVCDARTPSDRSGRNPGGGGAEKPWPERSERSLPDFGPQREAFDPPGGLGYAPAAPEPGDRNRTSGHVPKRTRDVGPGR
jgi:hypothetical protein